MERTMDGTRFRAFFPQKTTDETSRTATFAARSRAIMRVAHAAVLLLVLGICLTPVRGSNAPGCVICPSYVALSAQDKLAVLWNKTTQGVYTTGNQVRCAPRCS
jgi:hypothetical protein